MAQRLYPFGVIFYWLNTCGALSQMGSPRSKKMLKIVVPYAMSQKSRDKKPRSKLRGIGIAFEKSSQKIWPAARRNAPRSGVLNSTLRNKHLEKLHDYYTRMSGR